MFSLAVKSVRQRPGRFVATLLAAFLGAGITMTFNSLHDTAGAAHIDDTSAETLSVSASVVGGYGTLLVFFAIASTLTVNVRQRGEELALLRSTGATPAQIKRMVVGEALAVALVAAVLAIGPAMLGGRALFGMFQDSGQVAENVDYAFGPIAFGSGFAITLLAAVGAAFLAVRRATRALAGGRPPRSRLRNLGGAAALVLGAGSVTSTYAMKSTEPALMAAPAYGAILLSIGFAVFSPRLLRVLLDRIARPVARIGGAGAYLAVHNLRQRADQLASVLMPLILFTGVAAATLSMQTIENDAIEASGLTKSVDDKNLETLNLTVVGIIVVFACVMLVNSLYAATSYRTREFGRQRLAGSTPRQVLTTVGVEGLFLTLTGVFFGTVAGLAGTLPFNAVRTDTALPDATYGIWLAIAAIAATATLGTSLATTRRTLRVPAVSAVAVAA
ncbi:ABC transporter permease [Streptomyces sp. NA04227]|uniref:FtsX-like permease family protein n=1 Tax=Streptomyces sp. NA04227 TaxID=2742136 RepID=UPI0015910C1F|nr:ABC transporter permease [Streptomyces sp. NA04227]QKW10965.1 ABC transporter permease [Streptomyces sp. NA04227]